MIVLELEMIKIMVDKVHMIFTLFIARSNSLRTTH